MKDINKLSIDFLNDEYIQIIEHTLFYKGFEYKNFKSTYIKKQNNNKNVSSYRCKNYRKNSAYMKGLEVFCYSENILTLKIENKEQIPEFF